MPTKDELEAQNQQLLAQLQVRDTENAELQKKLIAGGDLDKYTSRKAIEAAQASAGLQPTPALVRPGLVWDHQTKRAIPYEAPPAARFKITAPNKAFQDEKAGVKFLAGIGYTDDPQLADWFKTTLSYTVVDLEAKDEAKS